MQLRAVLADQRGKNYLVVTGTGSGKTRNDFEHATRGAERPLVFDHYLPSETTAIYTGNLHYNTRYRIPTVDMVFIFPKCHLQGQVKEEIR